jgi:hypothetical protein
VQAPRTKYLPEMKKGLVFAVEMKTIWKTILAAGNVSLADDRINTSLKNKCDYLL